MTFKEKIESNYYNNNQGDFYADALEELGLTDHPKADKLYVLAYEFGHSNGYSDVWYYMNELAELVK